MLGDMVILTFLTLFLLFCRCGEFRNVLNSKAPNYYNWTCLSTKSKRIVKHFISGAEDPGSNEKENTVIERGKQYTSLPIPVDNSNGRQYIAFLLDLGEWIDVDEKITLLEAHFNEAGKTWTVNIAHSADDVLHIKFNGCDDLQTSSTELKSPLTLEFSEDPNIKNYISLKMGSETIMSLDSSGCSDHKTWFTEKWFSGSISFPEEQEVKEFVMLKSDSIGKFPQMSVVCFLNFHV